MDNVLIGSDDLSLTVTGTNFMTETKVYFGTDLLSSSSVVATSMKVVIPKTLLTAAKIVSITASNPTPGGGKSNAVNFTVKNPLPTLTSLSLTTAYVGSPDLTLGLAGKGFTAGARVRFGSNDLTPASVTDTALSLVVPATLLASTGVVPITVSNPEPGGGASSALDFTIGYPVPAITSFTASSTLVDSTGFSLEIDGSGFNSATRIHFGADELSPSAVTSSHITVSVPDALLTTARVVAVTASNPTPLGGTSNSLDFGVHNPVPTITALSVNTAEAGLEADLALEVTGTKFVSGATVDFGPHKLTPASPVADKLSIMIPVAALAVGGEMSVTVTNPGPGGGASNAVAFSIKNPVPQLTALSQQEATAGNSAFELLLIGAKFVSTTAVDFGGTMLTPASVSKGEIVVSVPESAIATGGVIQVKAVSPEPGGGSSGSVDFTINNPVPAIASVSPTSITNTGSDVVVNLSGSNFVTKSKVVIGADSATSTWVSKTELQVTLPAALVATGATAGSLSISVSNPAPAGGASDPFNLIVHDKAEFAWRTVANGTSVLPGTTTPYNLFGQASINASGMAVFKGQSVVTVSGSGESSATTGIYTADLANNGVLAKVADIAMEVPDPNTQTYGLTHAKFGTFPSFPKIDEASSFVGFNATHPPVIALPSGKGGSAGVYSNPGGVLDTGVGLFVADTTTTYPYFENPDLPGTAFGAFPGSPSVVNGNTLVFKADYLSGTTVAMGVYSRNVVDSSGASLISRIASTYSTQIPTKTVKFGYIGAPSASGSTAVFVGYDKKDAPTVGGIYSAPLTADPALTPLVKIGDKVPGEATTDTFTRFGDAVSFDGRYVGFWGAWGTETKALHVDCSTISDAAMKTYCEKVFPGGADVQVPVHQGMFVYDTTTESLSAVAKTGNEFSDFTYWPFVGTLPEEGAPTDVGGGGGEEEVEVPLEPPAFVLSPNIAVAGQGDSSYQVVFKAKTGPVDGIYSAQGPDFASIQTVLDTTMSGTAVDAGAASTSKIKILELEREGLRGSWLAIGTTTSITSDGAKETTSAGVYATTVSTQ